MIGNVLIILLACLMSLLITVVVLFPIALSYAKKSENKAADNLKQVEKNGLRLTTLIVLVLRVAKYVFYSLMFAGLVASFVQIFN